LGVEHDDKAVSRVVKEGMLRVCRDFGERVERLGFRRKGRDGESWERRSGGWIEAIHLHRGGCSYGAPTDYGVDIRVEFSVTNLDGTPREYGWMDSDPLRDGRGYAYHTRFNAYSGDKYERCVEDLMRVVHEHGLGWFARGGGPRRLGVREVVGRVRRRVSLWLWELGRGFRR